MANRRRDFGVFVSPVARTERRTAIDGGTGGSAFGTPIRSTSAQTSARTSSVRAPVSSDSSGGYRRSTVYYSVTDSEWPTVEAQLRRRVTPSDRSPLP